MAKKKSAKKRKPGALRIPEGDSVFFPMVPRAERKDVHDGDPESLGGKFVVHHTEVEKKPPRFIGARKKRSAYVPTGVMIPVDHFRPMVKRLIDKGEIDPNDEQGTIHKLVGITNELIPFHTPEPKEAHIRDVAKYGDYLRPLIAIKNGEGCCNHWAAVFTALGRAAGLKVVVSGHPRFFEGDAPKRDMPELSHMWPVVINKKGEKIKVHVHRPIFGVDTVLTELGFRNVDKKVRAGNYLTYKEYVPTKPMVIPEELKVKRPDVFGE